MNIDLKLKTYEQLQNEVMTLITNGYLKEENNQLQSNWNSLRELIIKRLDRYDRLVSKEEGIEIEILMWVRNKMNELEGKDKE